LAGLVKLVYNNNMKKQSVNTYVKQYVRRQQRTPLDPASWQTPEQRAAEQALVSGKNLISFKKLPEK
jgi:hypothetical protein